MLIFFSFEFFSLFINYLKTTSLIYSIFAYADYLTGFENFKFIIQNDQLLNGSSFLKVFFLLQYKRELWPEKPYDVQYLIVQLYQNPFVGGTSQSITFLEKYIGILN